MNQEHAIPATTRVLVTRTVKAFFTQRPEVHGPMSIAEARRKGWLSTSSGTVTVRMVVAAGPMAGCNVYLSGDQPIAQQDTA